jgi:hypothetical protein
MPMPLRIINSAHPEERLSLSKTRLEGHAVLGRGWFETGLRQAQSLLTMSGSVGFASTLRISLSSARLCVN